MSKSTLLGVKLPPIVLDAGTPWMYDDNRSKWLSAGRVVFMAGRSGRIKNGFLRTVDGQVTNLTGYRMPRDATITTISVQTRTSETWTLHIRKNGTDTNILSVPIIASTGAHDTLIDVDLDEGDRIHFFAETTTLFGIKDPIAWIEVAWKHDLLI
jgi:hypothetical protein